MTLNINNIMQYKIIQNNFTLLYFIQEKVKNKWVNRTDFAYESLEVAKREIDRLRSYEMPETTNLIQY